MNELSYLQQVHRNSNGEGMKQSGTFLGIFFWFGSVFWDHINVSHTQK